MTTVDLVAHRLTIYREWPHVACVALFVFLISGFPSNSPAEEKPRYNVLFIAVDDMGNVLQGAGHPLAKTPNLDKLAARGVRFDRAYNQIPLCNPSRASVMTGLRPDALGVYDLARHFRDTVPDVITLPQWFRMHKYKAMRIGKIYHYEVPTGIGTDGLDDKLSWERTVNPKGRDVREEYLITNAEPHRPISGALSWLAAEGDDTEQTDGMIASEAITQLAAFKDKPFFLGVGFFRPHTPFVAPKKYFDLYPLEQMTLPIAPANDRDDIPKAAFAHNNPVPNYQLPEPVLREAMRGYLASVSFVDAQIGRVMDALERLNLSDKTIVVFWSDHGYHLGEHIGIWQKRTLFEESARAPFIVVVPGSAAGIACRRVVEFVDLYPTIADMAGLSIPTGLAGRSLRPLLKNPDLEWNYPAITQIVRPNDGNPIMGRGIVNERWRYNEWDEGRAGSELYDHQTDPHEFINRINDPDLRDIIETMKNALSGKALGIVPPGSVDAKRL
jgi:iduronate 2-sulfatase